MITKGMMSSLRGDWKTPKALLKKLEKEFGVMFDPCPSNPKFDGLKFDDQPNPAPFPSAIIIFNKK